MFAVTAARFDADNPLAGLELGERPDPSPPEGWEVVTVKAASLNHHDVWTLQGVGISADRLPIILGCDAAGVDGTGREVVVNEAGIHRPRPGRRRRRGHRADPAGPGGRLPGVGDEPERDQTRARAGTRGRPGVSARRPAS